MPTVELDFVADEKDVVSSFDRVGAASKNMADEVDNSSSSMRDSTGAFDTMSEGADTAETRFTGFYDTLGGTRDALTALGDESLSTTDRMIALGQAGADLAGGLVGFVIPMVKSLWASLMSTTLATNALAIAKGVWATVTGTATTAMTALNAVMKANPIITIISLIALLVGAFIWLWNNSEGFRNFWKGLWDGIKSAVGSAVDWIKGAWNTMIGFFRWVGSSIGNIFSGLGGVIQGAFKGTVNFLIDILNAIIWALNKVIYGANLVNPFDDIPSIPKIPRLHSGGTVPGMPGEEVLTVLQAGEHVSMSGQGGGSTRIVFAGDTNSAFATAFMELQRSGQIVVEVAG